MRFAVQTVPENGKHAAGRDSVKVRVGSSTRTMPTSALLKACSVKVADVDAHCDVSSEVLPSGRAYVDINFPGFRHLRLNPHAARDALQPTLAEQQLDATHLGGVPDLSCGDRKRFFEDMGVTSKQAGSYRKRSVSASAAPAPRSPPETPPRTPAAAEAPTPRSTRSTRRAGIAPPAATRGEAEAGNTVSESPAKGAKRKEPEPERSSSPEPPATAEAADDSIGAFERARLERIRKNEERMRQLNLAALAIEVEAGAAASKPARPRGVSAKRQRTAAPPPVGPRRTTRSIGISVEDAMYAGGVSNEERGRITLAGVPQYATAPNGGAAAADEDATPEEPVRDAAFRSINCDADDDATFLRHVAAAGDCSDDRRWDGEAAPLQPAALRLREGNVAKVVKDGATCVSFMPSTSACVLAVADKRGHVGLWVHNPHDPDGEALAALGQDGVLLAQPHRSYISGLQWLPQGGQAARVVTSSYDGSTLLCDAGSGRVMVVRHDESDELSAMGARDASCVLTGDNLGNVSVLDVRVKDGAVSAGVAAALNLHKRKVNSIHFQGAPGASTHTFTTSSTDGTVCIWDLRQVARGGAKTKALATLEHQKACHGAYFHPGGAAEVLTTSYDDTIRVWSNAGKGWAQAERIKHNNQTGRWISPFKAIWSADGGHVLCGDLKRGMFCAPRGGGGSALLTSEFMTAIPPRLACHAALGVVAGATGSGRVHLWTRE